MEYSEVAARILQGFLSGNTSPLTQQVKERLVKEAFDLADFFFDEENRRNNASMASDDDDLS